MRPRPETRPRDGITVTLRPWLLSWIWVCALVSLRAEDWPQFLGPYRNGSTTNTISSRWGADGPARRWKLGVGSGFSGPVVRAGKVLFGDRTANQERVRAFDLASGKTLWEHLEPSTYVDAFGFDNGPRATPATTADRVVTFGAEGRLLCLRLTDGTRAWSVETGKDLGGDKGFFGAACSPLIFSNRVFLNLGSRDGGGVAAFDLETGKLIWKRTSHEAGYASPTLLRRPGTASDVPSWILFFTREGLVGLSPDGAPGFEYPWRSRQNASVNAATPLVVSNEVFLTASYDTGASLLKIDGTQPKVIWSGDESLSAHYATPVVHDGFLYGYHGRQESGPEFRCVEWRTGKVRWSQDGLGAGTVALAGSQLVLLLESGEIVIAEAQPSAFKILARAAVLGRGTRAPFALAEGSFVARDPRQLICLKLD